MISVIVPSYNEPYLNQTLEDILKKSEGEVEILVNLDGELPKVIEDKRITYFHNPQPIGMRAGINLGLKHAKGKYVMKTDAHCVFAQGWDKELVNMEDNWMVIPRRYSLHADNWDRVINLPVKDYHYFSFPNNYPPYGKAMFNVEWKERMVERFGKPEYDIDDTMTFQGSCWFVNKDYFMKRAGYLDEDKYSTFSAEPFEVGLKYSLGGGEVKVNKKTWYAHLFKNKRYYGLRATERRYKRELKNIGSYSWATDHWMNNKEPKMIHKFEWLVDKFWPLPGWPENWREL